MIRNLEVNGHLTADYYSLSHSLIYAACRCQISSEKHFLEEKKHAKVSFACMSYPNFSLLNVRNSQLCYHHLFPDKETSCTKGETK